MMNPNMLARNLTRRQFALGSVVGAATLTLLPTRSIAAQGTTPAAASALSGLGLPEVRIRITDTAFEGVPDQMPAGWVLLTVENTSSATGETGDANFVRPPTGVSAADVQALFAPPSGTPSAGPPPSATASLEAGGGLPSWFYRTVWAGAPLVPVKQTMRGIVQLTPGDWVVANDSPGAPQHFPSVNVTGGAASPATFAEPKADVQVELQEYAFVGLEKGVPAGRHVWKFANTGKQPHIMVVAKGPAGITMEQVMTLVNLPDGATPPPSFPYKESDFDFAQPGLGAISPGVTSYVEMELAPGTYIALCFVPDEKTGMPHAMMGMIGIFTVGGAGTPGA